MFLFQINECTASRGFFPILLRFLYLYSCVCVCICARVCAYESRCLQIQKRTLHLLKLELQVFESHQMQVLETNFQSSTRAANPLTPCPSISLDLLQSLSRHFYVIAHRRKQWCIFASLLLEKHKKKISEYNHTSQAILFTFILKEIISP